MASRAPGITRIYCILADQSMAGDPKFKAVSEKKNHGKAPDVFVGKRIYDKPSWPSWRDFVEPGRNIP